MRSKRSRPRSSRCSPGLRCSRGRFRTYVPLPPSVRKRTLRRLTGVPQGKTWINLIHPPVNSRSAPATLGGTSWGLFVDLDAHLAPFRRTRGAMLLAVVALVGWFAVQSPAWAGASSSKDAISRGTDAVQPTARTSESRTEKRESQPTIDGARRAEAGSARRRPSILGPCDHHARADTACSSLAVRAPPIFPTV
jgi:hypothetical protein